MTAPEPHRRRRGWTPQASTMIPSWEGGVEGGHTRAVQVARDGWAFHAICHTGPKKCGVLAQGQHAITRDDRMAARSAIYPKPPRWASVPLDTVLDRADAEPTSLYQRRGAGDRLIGVRRSFAGRVRSHRQTRG